MKRMIVAALAVLCLAAPAAAQAPTLKRDAPPVASALGEPVARNWAIWHEQYLRALGKIAKPVGDIEVPELGADFTKVPAAIPTKGGIEPLIGWTQDYPGGQKGAIAPTGRPDTVGAFRFICNAGQVSYDDPLVYPNQPGKSHLHQWFGNTAANASSTYGSLRTTGDSTCMNILNRSAYWMPAMLDGKGHVVRPDYISVYYKRLPADSPECTRQGLACVALPRGLRFIFGHDAMTGKPATGGGYFDCAGPTAKPGHYGTITEAAANCPAGNRLGAIISASACWDGKRLDSPNHRDHVADPGYGSWGYLKCPETHPYVIPSFTMGAWYTVDAERADSWYLSSDEMPGMPRREAGATIHADWFGAWDDEAMAMWMDNCINKLLSCNAGDLGNGRQMKETNQVTWKADPRLIPVPVRPQ